MSSIASERRAATTQRFVASGVSEVLGPMPVGVALSAGVGAHSAGVAGAGWGMLAICFAAVLPYAVTWRVRHTADGSPHKTQTRVTYLLVTLLCAAAGLALVASLGAPHDVVVVAVMIVAGLLLCAAANARWRVSNHAAGLAGAILTLSVLYAPLWLTATPLVGLLGWARVRLGRHRAAEVLAGAALGGVVGAVVPWLLG